MMSSLSQKRAAAVDALGIIENASDIFQRMIDENASKDMIATLRRRLYQKTNGGYLIATLKEPVELSDGHFISSALIKGDSSVELSATKQIGREVVFTIVVDHEGIPFVKSYV